MTTPFQLRHLRLRYESIPKQFRSRWLIGLLLGGGLTGVGFGIYRAIVPAQNASQLIYNSETKAMLERPTDLSSFKR